MSKAVRHQNSTAKIDHFSEDVRGGAQYSAWAELSWDLSGSSAFIVARQG